MIESIGIYTLIGIITGILTGITGSSGVIVVVPAMTFLGHSFHIAVGTSLLVDVITTASVVYVYTKGKKIDWRIGLILGGGALLGAQIGFVVGALLSATLGLQDRFNPRTIFSLSAGLASTFNVISVHPKAHLLQESIQFSSQSSFLLCKHIRPMLS